MNNTLNSFSLIETNKETIYSEVILVTPELAQEWLNKNHRNNRTLSEATITRYVAEMKEGRWGLSDSIKFDKNGTLIDGQHRLLALIKSEKQIHFVVTRGFGTSAIKYIDKGKARTMSNTATIKGLSWLKPKETGILNALYHSHTNKYRLLNNISMERKIEMLLSLKDAYDFFKDVVDAKKIGSLKSVPVPIMAVLYRAFYSKKCDDKLKLKDFLFLLFGYDYSAQNDVFSQTELNPALPRIFLEYLQQKKWQNSKSPVAVHQYQTMESCLSKYLSNVYGVKTLLPAKQEMFPVYWIDDFSFNRPLPFEKKETWNTLLKTIDDFEILQLLLNLEFLTFVPNTFVAKLNSDKFNQTEIVLTLEQTKKIEKKLQEITEIEDLSFWILS